METAERMPNSPELIHESTSYGNDTNVVSESSQGQSFQTTCEAGFISNKSPRASQELSSGIGPRKNDQTHVKTKAGASGGPRPPILSTNVDSCSSAKSSDANPARTTLIKRIVRSDGFYLEAKVNRPKMVFTIDTGAS